MYDPIKEMARLEEIDRKHKEDAQKKAIDFARSHYEKIQKPLKKEIPFGEGEYCGHDLYLENQGGSQGNEPMFVGQHKEMFDGA